MIRHWEFRQKLRRTFQLDYCSCFIAWNSSISHFRSTSTNCGNLKLTKQRSCRIDFEFKSLHFPLICFFTLSWLSIHRITHKIIHKSLTLSTNKEAKKFRLFCIFTKAYNCFHWFHKRSRLSITRPIRGIVLLKLNEKNATGRSTPPWWWMWKTSHAWFCG